jgi:hypothetical protein
MDLKDFFITRSTKDQNCETSEKLVFTYRDTTASIGTHQSIYLLAQKREGQPR